MAAANRTAVSCEQVEMITADLRYKKLCTQFVRWMLTEELKQKQTFPSVTVVIWMWRWWIVVQNSDWGWKLGASFKAWKLDTDNGIPSKTLPLRWKFSTAPPIGKVILFSRTLMQCAFTIHVCLVPPLTLWVLSRKKCKNWRHMFGEFVTAFID